MKPELHELLTSCDYEEYLEKQMYELHERNQNKQGHISSLESEISRLSSEHSAMQAELNSHLSIKRSAKLTIGNIKRRVNGSRH